MKALTLHQPWASLVALGVKTIETRSWSTDYRGPLAIHAGKSARALDYLCWMEEHQGEAEEVLIPLADRITVGTTPGGLVKAHHDLPLGAIVATCTLVDVVPMVEGPTPADGPHLHLVDTPTGLHLHHFDGAPGAWSTRDFTDQRPYGDFSPGRYAWLLDDVKPTTERCPACWTWDWPKRPCSVCDDNGGCDPVPARGRQGLWEWTP